MELEKIWHDLLSKCEKRYTLSEIEEIKKAYDFGVSHHKGKIRLDKTEYMTHPIGVSLILLDLNVDSVTIVSALIHETINHGGATKEEIETIKKYAFGVNEQLKVFWTECGVTFWWILNWNSADSQTALSYLPMRSVLTPADYWTAKTERNWIK